MRWICPSCNKSTCVGCEPVEVSSVPTEVLCACTDSCAKDAEIERLRAALHSIIYLDHHNHGPENAATKLARAALNNEQTTPKCLDCGKPIETYGRCYDCSEARC